MAVTAKIEGIAVLGGIAGTAIATLTPAPYVGAILIGASAATAVAGAIVNAYVSRLAAVTAELASKSAQYDAAHTTLSSQRQRMRAELEAELYEHIQNLKAAHRADIFNTQRESFEEGATAVILGRLRPTASDTGDRATVIKLDPSRPRSTSGRY